MVEVEGEGQDIIQRASFSMMMWVRGMWMGVVEWLRFRRAVLLKRDILVVVAGCMEGMVCLECMVWSEEPEREGVGTGL